MQLVSHQSSPITVLTVYVQDNPGDNDLDRKLRCTFEERVAHFCSDINCSSNAKVSHSNRFMDSCIKGHNVSVHVCMCVTSVGHANTCVCGYQQLPHMKRIHFYK